MAALGKGSVGQSNSPLEDVKRGRVVGSGGPLVILKCTEMDRRSSDFDLGLPLRPILGHAPEDLGFLPLGARRPRCKTSRNPLLHGVKAAPDDAGTRAPLAGDLPTLGLGQDDGRGHGRGWIMRGWEVELGRPEGEG